MSPAELALACVGLAFLYHNGPRWLIPPVKPFTCAVCMTLWFALAYTMFVDRRAWPAIAIGPLLAGLLVLTYPSLFYTED